MIGLAPCRLTAHPRSRGENTARQCAPTRPPGSSPLTRGKRDHSLPQRLVRGLIPAHAGKTQTDGSKSGRPQAHPRSRGENASVRAAISALSGSSPLTRGKLKVFRFIGTPHRLIPAHAGKTPHVSQPARGAPAHPRSRGENTRRRRDGHDLAGSSPLTRGKHPGRPHRGQGHRLIPAHAGKTRARLHQGRSHQAHPRSRGENRVQCRPCDFRGGSSPLTRGKLRRRRFRR